MIDKGDFYVLELGKCSRCKSSMFLCVTGAHIFASCEYCGKFGKMIPLTDFEICTWFEKVCHESIAGGIDVNSKNNQ
jgi:hypothetical protein